VLAIHPDFVNYGKGGDTIMCITMDIAISNGCTEWEWEGVWELEFFFRFQSRIPRPGSLWMRKQFIGLGLNTHCNSHFFNYCSYCAKGLP
jgi:hypothetical protein